MNAPSNRQWVVARPPQSGGLRHQGGLALTEDVFGRAEEPVGVLDEGQVLIRAMWFSPDPMNHAWVRGLPGKFDAIAIGQPMKGGVAGRVIASRHPEWREGDGVTGFLDWSDYSISNGVDGMGVPLQRVPTGLPLESGLATLGMTGLCAWLGMTEIGKPRPGDTVLVSGASGAIGSIAGQIARLAGARAIGIARGPAKCEMVRSLGYDHVIDALSGDLTTLVAESAPEGIDAYFDNVGGPMLDAALANLAHGARVVICGATAHYGGPTPVTNHLMLAMKGATMAGFFYFDHIARWPEGRGRLARWLAAGKIKEVLDVSDGFDSVPEAALAQFRGGVTGRKLVRIADDPYGPRVGVA